MNVATLSAVFEMQTSLRFVAMAQGTKSLRHDSSLDADLESTVHIRCCQALPAYVLLESQSARRMS